MPEFWRDSEAYGDEIDSETFIFYFDNDEIKICEQKQHKKGGRIFNTHFSFLGFISGICVARFPQGQSYATVTEDLYDFPNQQGYAVKRVYY